MQLFDLSAIPQEVLPAVGGKAARLCQLIQKGFCVPAGFVIYDAKTDEDIVQARKYWETLGLGNCAVRSSALGEDGSFASSAGQYETVLNVADGTSFEKAVHTCLTSLSSSGVAAYQRNFGESGDKRMTVVVQKMVQPYAAGVCFSKDPSGQNCTLIEAVRGLGEALVSGTARPDEYRVSGSDILRQGKILTDAQILEIAKGCRLAAEQFDFTADMEWAIDENGQLFWLQLRPVTTENLPTIDEFDAVQNLEGHVVTSCNISEMMPGAVTPLTHSTSVRALDWGVRKLLVHARVFPNMEALPPYSCYFSIGNHLFGDLMPIYRIAKTMVLASKPSIDMSICGEELKESSPPDIPRKALPIRIRNFILYITALMGKNKACRDADRIAETLSFDTLQSPFMLWREIDAKMNELNDVMYDHYISSAFSGMMSSALNLQLAPFVKSSEEQHAAVAGCLENIPEIESADILLKMYQLACAVKEEFPRESYTSEMMAECVGKGGRKVREAYDAFMCRHGHRSICECEMRNPSLCDDAETFFSQLAIVANGKEKLAVSDSDEWLKNRDKLLSCIPKNKRAAFKYMIDFSRTGAQIREYTKSRIVKVTYKFKKAYVALAEKLVCEKLLPDTDLIYFLTHEEIGKLTAGQGEGLVKKAMARRRLYPMQQRLKFRTINFTRPQPLENCDVTGTETCWNGTPVSRGIAEGTARVVRSVQDANELKRGEIMIAGFTDAGWTPYYSIIGGLVTEVGAALSHGAVVAREYSLPLVTNVCDITYTIRTGDIVRVDGTAGTIELLSRAV